MVATDKSTGVTSRSLVDFVRNFVDSDQSRECLDTAGFECPRVFKLVECFTGILPRFSRMLSLPLQNGGESSAGGDFVRQWITRWSGYLAAYLAKKEGNVFIENGIWIIIVVLAMIIPIEALRNALVNAFGQITSNLNTIP